MAPKFKRINYPLCPDHGEAVELIDPSEIFYGRTRTGVIWILHETQLAELDECEEGADNG